MVKKTMTLPPDGPEIVGTPVDDEETRLLIEQRLARATTTGAKFAPHEEALAKSRARLKAKIAKLSNG
ncbi:MAG: hypothetical protein V4463_23030 [Pseudomonadota bacterium]